MKNLFSTELTLERSVSFNNFGQLLYGCKRIIELMLSRYVLHATLGVAIGVGCNGLAWAQNAVMTTEDLGRFFDEHATREMEKANIAGAAIAVVKDDKVLFVRGYGYADVARKIPVSPDDTLFRIASISKVVTYTAVMQLVEQRKIDLDADVTRYLDFPIPPTFAKPITMRNLMTHTAGFEDTVQGRWVEPGKMIPMHDYLVQQLPRRLFAPGTVPAYSSYGTTLAGYIVERVSGEPFETYIERHVFEPLGMRHSSFAQPLPQHLGAMLTKGYDTRTGPASPPDTAQAAPAASMSSSAMDMARFMAAHLGGAAMPGPSLLTPATLAQMHTVQFRHHPEGPGMALGLYEMDEVAPRLLGHTGDIPRAHSGLYLFPKQRIGLFIVQNTEAGDSMRNTLLKLFAERYLASPPHAPAMPREVTAEESEQIPGSYLTTRRIGAGPPSLKFLMDQSVVRMVRPGILVVDTHLGLNGQPVEWQKVDTGWQSTTNPLRRLYFIKNAQGEWEMSSSRDPAQIMQKVSWPQHKLLILTVLSLSLVVILLSIGRNRLAGLLALAPWLLYGGIGLVVMNDLLFIASPTCAILLRVVQVLAWLAAGGTLAAICTAWRMLHTRDATWLRKAHQTSFCLACLGPSAMAWQGGFLIWNGRY
jgi:CubicO group peptidase (beta-lactamase class C family)